MSQPIYVLQEVNELLDLWAANIEQKQSRLLVILYPIKKQATKTATGFPAKV